MNSGVAEVPSRGVDANLLLCLFAFLVTRQLCESATTPQLSDSAPQQKKCRVSYISMVLFTSNAVCRTSYIYISFGHKAVPCLYDSDIKRQSYVVRM